MRAMRYAILVAATVLAGLSQLSVSPAQAATCSSGVLDGSFASAPLSGSVSSVGEVDCYTLPSVSAGNRISVGFDFSVVNQANPRWTVVDGNGNSVCESFQGNPCLIAGASEWFLRVYDVSETGTFSYSVVARRLTNPQGCSSLGDPAEWSFAAPRLDDSIGDSLGANCYAFSRSLGEADGHFWFRTVRSAGSLNPIWSVYGPSGARECQGSTDGLDDHCSLLAFGQFAFVVSGGGSNQTGSFFATARRLDSPSGCVSPPSTIFGASPTAGSISPAGDADCYALSSLSAGESVAIALAAPTGSSHSPRWTLIDGEGNRICDYYSGFDASNPCKLTGANGWSLIVYDASGPGTFSYALSLRRLTNPEGCSPLGDPAVWSFASPRLDGSIGGTLDVRCYTFTREPGEVDGSYWFRTSRSSGTLNPRWAVFGPSGSKECSGGENGLENPCDLLASGKYVFTVFDASGEQAGSFFATARRLTSPAGCSALPSMDFGASPVAGDLSTGGSVDCYSLPGVTVGDSLTVGLLASSGSNPSPRWTLVDANGNPICGSNFNSYGSSCSLSGSTGWSLLVYDAGAGSFSYSLAVRRLTDPQGCTPLGDPGVWSFTAPRLNGSISGNLGSRCYTFTRSIDDPDGVYWFRTLRSSGTLAPVWSVYGPTGTRECYGSTNGPEDACPLLASGQFSFVVSDVAGSQTGSYFATAKRLTEPVGCAPLPSIASGLPPTFGNLSTGAEADCYVLSAAEADLLDIDLSGAADRHAIVAPDGSMQCPFYNSQCHITKNGPHALIVYASGTGSGSYHVEMECENPPCGQTETALVTAEPNKIGQSQFATVLLRGHDLDLLDEVTLSKAGQKIQGEIQEPAKDGRAVDVRFDLEDVPTGSWSLSGHFIDGSTRLLPGGITVEAPHEATLSVEAVGRSAFRVGVPTPLSVVVHNPGNVDATAVPVVLRGLPAGATIAPDFDTYAPSGASGNVSLTKIQFDQAAETVTEGGEIIAPFLLARIPAGRSVSMDFMVTVPTVASYKVRAMVGRCLTATNPGPAALAARVTSAGPNDGATCAGDVAKVIAGNVLDAVPFGSCGSLAAGLIIDGVVAANGGEDFWSWSHAFGWAADGAWCLGEVVAPQSHLIKVALDVGSEASGLVGEAGALSDCLFFASQASLSQQSVVSIDPNELQGPMGTGAQHYIQANGPLAYKILFENVASATAAAETIKIRNPLDGKVLDSSSVRFVGIRFGDTQYTQPYPSPTLDETFDLRPGTNVQVRVTASVVGQELRADLVAVDPDTLETPEDPSIGVLSPNVQPPEGEGELLYTVAPRLLPSGATIANTASIQFDQNAPIITPTWSNVVDRQAPAPSVAADTAPEPLVADVSWGGSDDAAGIALWRLEVSKNGASFQLWRTATSADEATYEAPGDGNYSFRAVAYDGAGNVGQSSLAGVTLQATSALTVAKAGSGSGTVLSSPGGIQCGPACSKAFPHGTEVTLTASADPGSAFAGWSGGGCSGAAACTVDLLADASVTARFDQRPSPAAPLEARRPGPPAVADAEDRRREECVSVALRTFQKAGKAAKRRHGSSRSKAMKAARKKKEKSLAQCKARFS